MSGHEWKFAKGSSLTYRALPEGHIEWCEDGTERKGEYLRNVKVVTDEMIRLAVENAALRREEPALCEQLANEHEEGYRRALRELRPLLARCLSQIELEWGAPDLELRTVLGVPPDAPIGTKPPEPEQVDAAPASIDAAARELLFLAGVEGISTLSRGGKGCVFRAVELLRPDIAALWADHEDPFVLLRRFFPEQEPA